MPKIEKALICPECFTIMCYNPKNPEKESFCSECWMKNRKKVKMQKGIVGKGWDKRILKFNNQNILEKLKDALKNKLGAKDIRIVLNDFEGPGIYFKIDNFGLEKLKFIFHRWGLNWKDHIVNFGITHTEIIKDKDGEEITIPRVEVAIWIRKFLDMLTCDHNFVERKDWGYQICSKCGLFEKLSTKTNQKGKGRVLFIEGKTDWICPRCKSNNVALDDDKDHQDFKDQLREWDTLMHCCNCGQQFLFKYKLTAIELHSFKPIMPEAH